MQLATQDWPFVMLSSEIAVQHSPLSWRISNIVIKVCANPGLQSVDEENVVWTKCSDQWGANRMMILQDSKSSRL